MDPLSATASVIAVIQITVSVLSTCHEYRSSVKNAPQEAEQIISELSSLKHVLEQVLAVAQREEQSRPKEFFSLAKLTTSGGELDTCRENLIELQKKLQPQEGWRGVKNALTWHFKEGEFRKTLGRIGKSKDTLNLAMTVDTAMVSLSVQEDVAALAASFKAVTLDANQQKALDWLAAPDSSENQNAARRKHQATTGAWFVDGQQFTAWKTKQKSLLWLHGIPGCGKTIICSSVIQALNQHRQITPNTALAYFYFDFNDSKKSTLPKLLRSFVAQLATQNPHALPMVEKEYSEHGSGRQQPTLSMLSGLLTDILGLYKDVFLVIDALDECQERDDLLDWLGDFTGSDLLHVHLLLSSRQEKDIEDVLKPLVDSQISIQGADVDPDIRLYVEDRLSRDRKLKKWPTEIKEEIERSLMGKVNGMFRLADCQLDILCKCNNIVALRKELQSLPKTLEGTYGRILSEVDEIHADDALKVLQWLCFSARPVLLTEMVDVLAVDNQETFKFNPDLRYTDSRDILTICSSLISVHPRTIKRNPWKDEEEHVEELRLAHFSVKEYLVSERVAKGPTPSFHVHKATSSAIIAGICVVYLTQFRDYGFLNLTNISDYPLATYAAKYWTVHAREADRKGAFDTYQEHAVALLSDYEICRNWLSLWDIDSRSTVESDLEFIDLNEPIKDKDVKKPLYYACVSGLLGVAHLILANTSKDEDYNEVAGQMGTVLHAAAHSGNSTLIKLLIERGADVNATGGEWGTVLQAAAEEGHEEAVLTLLQHDADPNILGGFYGTALQAASYKGNLSIVTALLSHGAEANAKGGVHGSALVAAADRGNEAVMEVLLAHGVDINAQTMLENAALHNAAGMGRLRTVKLLLSKGADINLQGHYGATPLLMATMGNHTDIIQYLLEKGADPNLCDTLHGSPLANASNSGNSEAVLLLLNHGADVNQRAGDYGTPLAEAATRGHADVVDLLLAHGADAKVGSVLQSAMSGKRLGIAQKLIDNGASIHEYGGEYGFALQSASSNRNLDLVKFLVENGADVNARGGVCGTALIAAASPDGFSLPIIQYLIEHGADVNAQCGTYGSALQAAAQYHRDNPAIVAILLKLGADVNARSGRSCTALHGAMEMGTTKIATVLLKAGADIEARFEITGTPLHCAIVNQNESAANLMLMHGAAVNLQHEDRNDLHAAACNGLTKIVQKILDQGADVNAVGGRYGTALQASAIEGHSKTIALLLEKGADPNRHGGDRGPALQEASASESLRAVQLLVSAGADVHYKGGAGSYYTALQAAASAGEFKNVQYLLSLQVDVNVEGGSHGTALQAAAETESRDTVKALLKAGANVNAQGGEFGSALQAAAQGYEDSDAIVKILLDAGADVNASGGKFGYALQAAAYGGNLAKVKLLVANGADVNAEGGHYGTALLAAAEDGNAEIVDFLLANGADFHVVGPQGNVLYHAAGNGNEKIIQTFLDRGININSGWGDLGSALRRTIDADSIKATKLLLDRGVEVNEESDYRGTALIAAIRSSEEQYVKVLLAAGADVNAQAPANYDWKASEEWKTSVAADEPSSEANAELTENLKEDNNLKHGRSDEQTGFINALHEALGQDKESIKQLILAKTTNINAPGGEYGNALQAAIVGCHLGLVQQILDRGADVNTQGGKFHNALQAAATTGELKRVELILSHGPDVNVQGGEWGNALQAAAFGGYADVVECLLRRGAEINAQGGEHFTALQAAAFQGHVKVVQLLISRGADVNIHNEESGNALQAAAAQGQLEVVRLLRKAKAFGNRRSKKYKNALQAATDGGFLKVVKLLIRGWKCFRESEMSEKAVQSLLAGGHEYTAKAMKLEAELARCTSVR